MNHSKFLQDFQDHGIDYIQSTYNLSRYKAKKLLLSLKSPSRLCGCGCGEYAMGFNTYVNGHNQKGKPGVQHSEKTRKKISQKSKERFHNGQRINCKIYDIPPKEDLEYLYIECGFSMNKLSKMMDTSIPTLRNWLDNYKISRRGISQALRREYEERRIISSFSDPEVQKFIRQRSGIGKSSLETEIIDFLLENTSLTNQDVIQTHYIGKYEIDIFIPKFKLGIEYNGLYWHTEQFRPNSIHKEKKDICVENGIRLLMIWEDDWNLRNKVIKRKLLYLINGPERKFFARKCQIREIQTFRAKNFFEEFHIQGHANSTKYYGIFKEDELVGVGSFTKRKESSWELTRYCTKDLVVGGFSKLVKHFCLTHAPQELYSFADLSLVNEADNVYKTNGWEIKKLLSPDYKYYFNGKRMHKFNFRHASLRKILPMYDSSLSEYENCKINKVYRIWDCGKIKYSYPRIFSNV